MSFMIMFFDLVILENQISTPYLFIIKYVTKIIISHNRLN